MLKRDVDHFLMVNLSTRETGVEGALVWVASGEFDSASKHGPRVAVMLGRMITDESLGKAAIVTLADPSVVVGDLPSKVREQALGFVSGNREVLLSYWKGEVSTRDMLAGLVLAKNSCAVLEKAFGLVRAEYPTVILGEYEVSCGLYSLTLVVEGIQLRLAIYSYYDGQGRPEKRKLFLDRCAFFDVEEDGELDWVAFKRHVGTLVDSGKKLVGCTAKKAAREVIARDLRERYLAGSGNGIEVRVRGEIFGVSIKRALTEAQVVGLFEAMRELGLI